ncbi:pitrilysin family protein [uncultured Tateyamaria sp.]|uniref:M16 family metallopeptidase n=1 Tax=uncultured Tateyamaria sp. TaxID=455651 RepID=UPI0026069009|nr:pitrilysin family protein [uncultured Tateyamaria sp.]
MAQGITQTTLDNGIVIATDHAPHFNGVAITLAFRVGSTQEPEDLCGIAHLIEHLAFRGTAQRDSQALQKAFGRLGAETNGRTDEDSTVYTASILKDDYIATLRVMADMVTAPLFAPDDITLEKSIIEQENCRGCPNCSAREALYGVAFPDQSLRHPVIGYEDTIEAITRDDIVTFHRTHYVTGNLIVSIAGDVDHDDVVAEVQAAFADLPVGAASARPTLTFAPGEISIASGGDQASFSLLFDITSMVGTQQHKATVFYEDILGGHGFSRLMDELREKRGLVYSAWTHFEWVGQNNMLQLQVWCEARKMKEVCDVTLQTMRDVAQSLSQQDFEDARNRCRSGLLMAADNVERRSGDMVHDIISRGRVIESDEELAGYMALSRDHVAAAGCALIEQEPAILLAGSLRAMPKFAHLRSTLRGEQVKTGPWGLLRAG